MGRQERSTDNFEKAWKEAFTEVETTPPEAVWDRIDGELANSQVHIFQKKASIYKWVASVAVLVTVSVVAMELLFLNKNDSTTPTSTTETTQPTNTISSQISNNESSGDVEKLAEIPSEGNLNSQPIILLDEEEKSSVAHSNEILLITDEEENLLDPILELDLLGMIKAIIKEEDKTEDNWINKVPTYNHYIASASRKNNQRFWAGIGVGSGVYDPNYDLSSPSNLTKAILTDENFVNTSDIADRDEAVTEGMTAGVSYSMGVNFGMKLSKRWTLESGVQYAVTDITSKTNVILENDFFAQPVPNSSDVLKVPPISGMVTQASTVEYVNEDVELQNSFQFASIPLKAGYILLDKKLNFKLNAGIAADFYLGNTLKDSEKRVTTLEVNPGAQSPYRDMNFSGLAGVELGYRILDRLNLSIEPNYRHALQPATKGSSNFVTVPTGFGVQAGLRYSFR